jgi:hypothetical protein
VVARPDGALLLREQAIVQPADLSAQSASALGNSVAEKLLQRGAAALLAETPRQSSAEPHP